MRVYWLNNVKLNKTSSSCTFPAEFLFLFVKEPKELTEEEKAAQKARPVATNPIPGTPWYASHQTRNDIIASLCDKNKECFVLPLVRCVVWTGDDRVFFYNPTTRLSMWDRPDELVGRADVDKHIQEPPHKKGPEDVKKTSEDKQTF